MFEWKRVTLVAVLCLLAAASVVYYIVAPVEQPAEPLRYVIIPAGDTAASEVEFGPLVEYLSDALDREVELLLVADYTAVVEAMKYGHADMARFGPFNYVLATQEADVEAIVAGIKEKTGRAEYNALIISKADIQDLNGKTFAYVDVGSTSGYLAPTTYFMEEGIELGEVFFAGSHPAVIEAVRNETVDAGAIADNRYITAILEGVITEDELYVVWESDPIPNPLVAVQKSMDEQMRSRLVEAFLSMPRDIAYQMAVGEIGFVEVKDSDYDVVRRMQEAKGLLDSD